MLSCETSQFNDELWEATIMALPRPVRCLAATLLLLGLPPVFADDAPAKGDLWEVSSKMSIEGMPMEMPAGPTLKVCTAKTWTRPPAPANAHQSCRRSDYTVSGNKVTWTETCESPAMTGKGEIIRQGNDAYSGTISYASEQGNMTIKLAGHKIGTCDNPS
jgi:Protein of unknown function (DUF3617)